MKFTVSRQAILEAFQVVGLVISPRAVRPILTNVHLVVSNDMLMVLGTDLEMSIRFHVPMWMEFGGNIVRFPSASPNFGLWSDSETELEFFADQ